MCVTTVTTKRGGRVISSTKLTVQYSNVVALLQLRLDTLYEIKQMQDKSTTAKRELILRANQLFIH